MNNISIKCLKSEKIQSGTLSWSICNKFFKDQDKGITIGNQLRRVLLGDLGGSSNFSSSNCRYKS